MGFGEQLAEQKELVPEILSSPEKVGRMGIDQLLVEKTDREELAEQISEYGEKIATQARSSKDYEELLESFIEVSEAHWGPVNVNPDAPEEIQQEHIGVQYFIYCCGVISQLDEVTGTENEQAILDFIDDLEQQEYLSKVSSVVFLALAEEEEYILKVANQYNRRVTPLVKKVQEHVASDERELDTLIEIGEECGPLIETALSPTITLIHFLEKEEIHFDRASELGLRESVEYIRDFDPLASVGEAFNVNYRNSFHHGGKDGGLTPNPLLDKVHLRYRKNNEIRTETVDAEEFERVVLRMVSAVVALFLLPFIIITGHVTADIGWSQNEK